jgi:monoamine oxidase
VTALPYDDGTDRVPGDIVTPVERVVVVGAGIAGLAAANALAHAGVPSVVLEARGRVGGRLHTADVAGSPVDLGGSWIHSPIGNPLTAWAQQLGVLQRPAEITDGMVGVDPASGRLPDDEFRRLLNLALDDFESVVQGLAASGQAADSIGEVVDGYLAGQRARGMGRLDLARLRTTLLDVVESDASGPVSDIAAEGYPASGLFYEGSDLGDFPVGGYRRLVEPLARGLDTRTGRVVTAITVRPRGVEVATSDGELHAGSHALVTVPLGVLQAGAIRFDPPLPRERLGALGRLGFGRFEKVVLGFDRDAWARAAVPHALPLPADGRPELTVIVNLAPIVGEPVALGFAYGSRAGVIADATPEASADRLMRLLRTVAGGPVPDPVAAVVTTWGSDPYSLGAYAYLRVGATGPDLDTLGQPLWGRLLFAGEATGHARVGFADGAFSTGVREAKRLLGQPRVLLGPR